MSLDSAAISHVASKAYISPDLKCTCNANHSTDILYNIVCIFNPNDVHLGPFLMIIYASSSFNFHFYAAEKVILNVPNAKAIALSAQNATKKRLVEYMVETL